jgi:signal transduction histidine kinase
MQTMSSRAGMGPGFAVRAGWDALRTVLAGADRGPSWLADRPARLRRLTVAVVAVGTLVGYPLCAGLAARSHPTAGAWAALVGLGEVLPLALLVRYPLLAWRLGWLAALLAPLASDRPWGSWPWDPPQIPLLALAFCVAGLRHGRPVLWTMWALMLAELWIWVPDPSNSIGGSIAFTACTVLLDTLAGRRQVRQALIEQTERTRQEQSRRAVLEDRARIARELHDVVAHHMSLIAVQAETAPYRHQGVQGPVREDFAAISAMARDALTEMRRLLGVLRSEDPTEPQRAPQPGIDDLPELVDSARRAGLPVEVSLSGTDTGVPATIGLCAYRVVQESLSNAGRHATGAKVAVSVCRDPEGLRVSVTNGAVSRTRPPDTHATASAGVHGHGLAGMRERVTLVGGSLSAGPDGEGGFAVVAIFPVGSLA